MKLQDQVISLELAKNLKELGVKQDSLFYWWKPIDGDWILVEKKEQDEGYQMEGRAFSAFTVAELGEMLPCDFVSGKDISEKFCCWSESNTIVLDFIEFAKTEANARAKMLIYLINNNLISY